MASDPFIGFVQDSPRERQSSKIIRGYEPTLIGLPSFRDFRSFLNLWQPNLPCDFEYVFYHFARIETSGWSVSAWETLGFAERRIEILRACPLNISILFPHPVSIQWIPHDKESTQLISRRSLCLFFTSHDNRCKGGRFANYGHSRVPWISRYSCVMNTLFFLLAFLLPSKISVLPHENPRQVLTRSSENSHAVHKTLMSFDLSEIRSQWLTVPSPQFDCRSYEKHHANIFSLNKTLFKTILLIEQKSPVENAFNFEISSLVGSRIGFFRQMSSYLLISHSPITFLLKSSLGLVIQVNDLELIAKTPFFYSIIRTKGPISERRILPCFSLLTASDRKCSTSGIATSHDPMWWNVLFTWSSFDFSTRYGTRHLADARSSTERLLRSGSFRLSAREESEFMLFYDHSRFSMKVSSRTESSPGRFGTNPRIHRIKVGKSKGPDASCRLLFLPVLSFVNCLWIDVD
jgi:hypothetical protein